MAGNKLDPKLQAWVDARRRHHLSHAHVQMARELGMNPKKFGKIDNHHQERWKVPLPRFIESLYEKRFGRARPEVVRPIEASAADQAERRAKRKRERQRRREAKSLLEPESPGNPESGAAPAALDDVRPPDAVVQRGVEAPGR